MQSEVINRLKSAIEYVEADKSQDYADAETTGERVDLNDYDVSLSLEDAKALYAAMSAAEQQPAPSVAVKDRKPKLPPIENELYEFYPSMSAQTHADAIKEYARASVSAALSAQVQDVATEDPISHYVSQAVMSERQRCIQLCEAEYERRINSDYPADRRHDFVVVARAIQKAIREPVESGE